MKVTYKAPLRAPQVHLRDVPVGNTFRHPAGVDIYIRTDKTSRQGWIWACDLVNGCMYSYLPTKTVINITAELTAADEFTGKKVMPDMYNSATANRDFELAPDMKRWAKQDWPFPETGDRQWPE